MNLSKENMRKIAVLLTFGIVLLAALQNINAIRGVLMQILGLIAPFLLGACIAFILNVPLRFIERHLFSSPRLARHTEKIKRPISLVLVLLSVAGAIAIVVGLIVPQLITSLDSLRIACIRFFSDVQIWAAQVSTQYPSVAELLATLNFDWRTLDWEQIGQTILKFLNGTGDLLGSTFNIASSVVGAFFNFFVGLFFSIYILLQKEKLGRQLKKLLYACLPETRASATLSVCTLAQQTFSSFITGQCTEAVVLGTMFFISMSILRFPYAVLVGVLIAVTALIPIFGAFIGCAVGAFLILMVDPLKALWFLILFLILQQIEGNFIYPHVVGNSVGLPAIWVLVAVTVGGSTMGVPGMLICIPLFSIVYALVRTATNKKLLERGIEPARWGDCGLTPHGDETPPAPPQ